MAAVVVAIWLRNLKQQFTTRRVGAIRVVGGHLETSNNRMARLIRVINKKGPVFGITRMEGQSKQTALTAAPRFRANPFRDIQKRSRENHPASDNANRAALFNDKQPP